MFSFDGEDNGGADPEKEENVASSEVRTDHGGGCGRLNEFWRSFRQHL
jgi:hypothetical protein